MGAEDEADLLLFLPTMLRPAGEWQREEEGEGQVVGEVAGCLLRRILQQQRRRCTWVWEAAETGLVVAEARRQASLQAQRALEAAG